MVRQKETLRRKGTPLMRPVFMEFPEDPTTYTIDTQYFLGTNLLITPVFSKDGKVTFYVPEGEGEWVSWFDKKKRYEGGKWYKEVHDYFSLPILIRPGTVTAVNPSMKDSESDFREGLELLVNGPLSKNIEVELVDVVKPDQVTGTISVSSNGAEISVDGSAIGKSWSVSYLGNVESSEHAPETAAPGATTIRAFAETLAFRPV